MTCKELFQIIWTGKKQFQKYQVIYIVLQRDDLALAVAEAAEVTVEERFDHVVLAVNRSDAESVAERATKLGCVISRRNAPHQIFIEDQFEVEWELNTTSPPPNRAFDTLDI